MSEDERTIWLGNLNSEKVTEDVLYELFLQVISSPIFRYFTFTTFSY